MLFTFSRWQIQKLVFCKISNKTKERFVLKIKMIWSKIIQIPFERFLIIFDFKISTEI